jgi:uncharacterized protein YeaO (DUF488 family)
MSKRKRLTVTVKRAYEAPAKSDGCRVLVDHIWPRGVSKAALRLDGWVKEVAPSGALRKWFDHDPAKWPVFKSRYFRELDGKSEAIDRILTEGREGTLTLVFAAKDVEHSNATALKEYLDRQAGA